MSQHNERMEEFQEFSFVECLEISNSSSIASCKNVFSFPPDLPEQVVECLKLTGFDSKCALLLLKDVDEIESFLRENADMFLSVHPKSAAIAYAIFKSSPQNFRFLPGHKHLLQKFIKKIQAERRNQSTSSKNLYSRARSRSPPSASSEPQDPDEHDYSKSNIEDLEIVERTIQNNLTAWSKKQDGKLKNLQEDVHYSLTVTPTKKEVLCLICHKAYHVSKAKNSYVISNYTRHLMTNCTIGKDATNETEVATYSIQVESTGMLFDATTGQYILTDKNAINIGSAEEIHLHAIPDPVEIVSDEVQEGAIDGTPSSPKGKGTKRKAQHRRSTEAKEKLVKAAEGQQPVANYAAILNKLEMAIAENCKLKQQLESLAN